ncbi:MAG: Hsp20/alpha crystallin family protein [Phototrophicales bacterium]
MANQVARWNPFRELAAMQSAMDRIFEDTWRGFRSEYAGSMAVDVHENDDAYLIEAEIPGVKADDIHINLHDGRLTIEVETTREDKQENSRMLVQERFYGKMSRTFNLPQTINMDKVEAEYVDGVLKLHLPKAEESKPRQISVKAANNKKLSSGK